MKGLTQGDVAQAIGVSQPYISQIERTSRPIIPGPDVMEALFKLSEGLVEPNDFYAVPRWRRMLDAALAALAKAA